MRALIAICLPLVACASTASSTSGEAAAPQTGECLASSSRTRPSGWIDAGKIVVNLAGGKPVSIEAQDAAGKGVKTIPADGMSPQAAREAMAQAACAAGGVVYVVAGKPPDSGAFTLPVVRPAKEDEAGDLEKLCTEPADMPGGLDPSQRPTVAAHMYEETLTSTRYRAWLRRLDKAVHTGDAAVRAQSIDELGARAKAAGKATCWFPDALRR